MERHQQIENIARAFYDVQDHALSWSGAPETIKDEFRGYARDAMSILDESWPSLNPLLAASLAGTARGAGLVSA